jgi:hypothetical protein
MTASGRSCIFCGGTAGSAEHVFPNWINQVFPVGKVGRPQAELGLLERGGPQTKKTWMATGVATQTVKEVCHECNTGWMARVEGVTKPLIQPMALGAHIMLDLEQQLIVATWAVKTSMTAELVHGHDHNWPSHDRLLVMEQQRPPAHAYVAASAIETTIGPCRFVAARGQLFEGEKVIGWHHIYTIQVGTLLLQVLRTDPPIGQEAAFKYPQRAAQMEVPLFPPTIHGFFWPPPKIIDEAGFTPHTVRKGSPLDVSSHIEPEWPPQAFPQEAR